MTKSILQFSLIVIFIVGAIFTVLLATNFDRAQLLGFSTAQDCIITIEGKQYNVTPLRSEHPGGNIFICGTDMTETFLGQHGNDLERIAPYLVK